MGGHGATAAAPVITRAPHGGPVWREMVGLRHDVLRAPLGLAFGADELAAEADQLHLALWRDRLLVGTLLLVPPDAEGQGWGGATLRQMAIRPGHQRRGHGTRLVAEAERRLLAAGSRQVRLAARATAVGFYARLGYRPEGAPFVAATLPHRTMVKALGPPD